MKTQTLRLGMAQINSTVGDLSGNTKKILHYIDEAKALGVDLLTFPELAITGYPPEDLLLKPQFIKQNQECLKEIVRHTSDIAVVVGFVDRDSDIYNTAAVIYNNKLAGVYHKIYLLIMACSMKTGIFRQERKAPFLSFTALAQA